MTDEHSAQTAFGAVLKAKGYDVALTGSGHDLQVHGEASSLDKWRKEDCICLTKELGLLTTQQI